MKLFDNKQTYCPVCNSRVYYGHSYDRDYDQHSSFNYTHDYKIKSGHTFGHPNNIAVIGFVIDRTSIQIYDDLKY